MRLVLVAALIAAGARVGAAPLDAGSPTPSARKAARRQLAGKPGRRASALEGRAAEGRRLRLAGRHLEARALLEPLVQREPRALAARLELGLSYRAKGERERERALWHRFYDDYEQGRIDKQSARELTYVALAARYLGGWEDANATFRDAAAADPLGPEGARAKIEWAALFLEKYDAGHAEQLLEEALRVLPEEADAHALIARVKLEQGYDVAAAEAAIARALAVAPRHRGALALRAELALDAEHFDEVLDTCAQILRDDPEEPSARTLIAAVQLLRGEERAFATERDRVLAANPRAAFFFHGVAETLIKAHRYLEADALLERAVALDPEDPVARAALGANLLRLGEESRGLEALRRAWAGDRFNVRTFNLLNLFEEVIPKAYTLIEGHPFRFRVPSTERAVLERTVKPMVLREYAELAARYRFHPQGPLTLELYANPQHYAVRTIGLPGLEAIGVTFGKVVTATSPSVGRFNWGMMLWHEVAHVFAIQLSGARVPRWFTEGLSEYETARARPEWTRHTHAELHRALVEGRLSPVLELNQAFLRARDVQHMVVAYHQAAELVSFLVRRWGFPKVVAALELYRAGKQTAEVLRTVTGLQPAAFDAAFRAELAARLKVYDGTFFVRPSDYSDPDALRERLRLHPEDRHAAGLYALALARAHKGEEAQRLVDRHLGGERPTEGRPDERALLLAAAELAEARKDRPRAHAWLERLLRAGGEGYDVRYALGRLAAAEGDLAGAERELALAKGFDPQRAEPLLELGRLLLKTPGREAQGLAELEAAARLDVMDPSIPLLLVERHLAGRRWSKVVEAARLALEIKPFDPGLHLHLAAALLELGRRREARESIALARACDPGEGQRSQLDALARRAAR